MHGSLLLWLFFALTVFWCVGVHNRLMRLRARGLDALGSMEKQVAQYPTLVQAHLPPPESDKKHAGNPPDAEHLPDEWGQLLAGLDSLGHALRQGRKSPLEPSALQGLGVALDAVEHGWEALRNTPVDLAGPAVPDDMRARWEAVTVNVHASRRGLNQILTKYDEARGEFPARLVVGLMGFRPAGQV